MAAEDKADEGILAKEERYIMKRHGIEIDL